MNGNSIRKTTITALAVLLVAGLTTVSTASMGHLSPLAYHVTFDNGPEGWSFATDPCNELFMTGGNPGAYMNTSRQCEDWPTMILTGWWSFFKPVSTPEAQVLGNATMGVRLSVDVNVNSYDFWGWFGPFPVEQYRKLVLEIRDYDNPYTDPATGYSWPYTSVQLPGEALQDRNAGWKTFSFDINDLRATTLPEGWVGFGGPEDPNYMPQLPPDRTFADVIAGADEIRFTTLEPGWFYSLRFSHDLDVDNIRIEPIAPACDASKATVYVDASGIVQGGGMSGQPFGGTLEGTEGSDVIVGTAGDDVIDGLGGNDMICGLGGNDRIDGGDGVDVIHGGSGVNVCIDGELATSCQQ
jgi:hypothetical protein